MENVNLRLSLEQEAALIERIKQGERSAFDILVDAHKEKGLRMAWSVVGNLEDAKDVLQEAFLKVYLNIRDFKGQARFSTWFYRIVVNCAFDLLRKRRTAHKIFIPQFIDEEGKPRDFADRRYEPRKVALTYELAQRIDKGIEELPEKQKICFTLKHLNGLTNVEIAEVLRCSVSTVKVHLFRAVRALQDKLSVYPLKEGGRDV